MLYEHDISNSDEFTLDYFFQQNVCRLCWKTDAVEALFTKNETECVEIQLIDKIKDCLDLNITEDSYPKQVCKACCNRIEEFYKFKCFCLRNNEKLQEILDSAYNSDSEQRSSDVNIELLNSDGNIPKDEEEIVICVIEESGETEIVKKRKLIPETLKTNQATDYDSFSDCGNDYEPSDNELERYETEIQTEERKKKVKTKNIDTKNNSLSLEELLPESVLTMLKNKKNKSKISYCNICKTDLGSGENLSMHNSIIHGIEGNVFKCFGCEKRFRTRRAALAHEINTCKGLKDGYRCGECYRFLPNRSIYEAHMRDHKENPAVMLPENVFQCTKCHALFKTNLGLTEHMAVHDMEKKFNCEICGRAFAKQKYLSKHKLMHTKKHICHHCGHRAAQTYELKLHMRKHERSYNCDLCPQSYTSLSNLRTHISRRHTEQKKFKCTICTMKFGDKKRLVDHRASIHEGSQFSCDHCDATYMSIRALRRHVVEKHSIQE